MFAKKNTNNETNVIHSQKQYHIWNLSWFGLLVILSVAIAYEGITVLKNTTRLVATSNRRIVETAGIDITATLNTKSVASAKILLDKISQTRQLPHELRNIFLFDSYINNGVASAPATVTSSTTTSSTF